MMSAIHMISANHPMDVESSARSIQIVDFGQSFLGNECPGILNTRLPVRAAEIVFGDNFDYRVHLWSMACLVRPAS